MRTAYTLNVNGYPVSLVLPSGELREIFLPLLQRLTLLQKQKNERLIVFLAAPPGTGKSTLSLLLKDLSETRTSLEPIEALGMDGFHYRQDYLNTHSISIGNRKVPLAMVKGWPESFDYAELEHSIQNLRSGITEWPVYDRLIHDVGSEKISVSRKIVLIEGNYLLLDKTPWSELHSFCDYSIFIRADAGILKQRLILREQQGGMKAEEAELHYQMVDKPDIELVLNHSAAADLTLQQFQDFSYQIVQKPFPETCNDLSCGQ